MAMTAPRAAKANGKPPTIKRPQPWFQSAITVIITAAVTWTAASFLHSQPATEEMMRITTRFDDMPLSKDVPLSKRSNPVDFSDNDPSQLYDGPSRAFTKFEYPFPCVKGEIALMRETPAHEGILFQRPHKTGR